MAKMSLREYANAWLKDKGMSATQAKKDAGKYKSIAAAKKAGSLYYTDKNGKVMLAVYAEDLKGPKPGGRDSSPRPKLRPGSESAGKNMGVMTAKEKAEVDKANAENKIVREQMSGSAASVEAIANKALSRADRATADYEKDRKASEERRGPSAGAAFNKWFESNKTNYKKEGGGFNMKKALEDFNASRKSGMSKGGMAKRGGYMKGGSADRRTGMFYNSQSPRGYK